MPSAPYHLSISAARAGALFASPLQRSDEPSARPRPWPLPRARPPPCRVSHRLKVSTPRRGPLTVTGHGTGCERAGDAHRRWDTSPVSPRLVYDDVIGDFSV